MNKWTHKLLQTALLGTLIGTAFADDKVLVMGYPDRNKLPMIADRPNDEGIFKDLFYGAQLQAEVARQLSA